MKLLRSFLNLKTFKYKGLFSDDASYKVGDNVCKRLAAFCYSILDFICAIREVIPNNKKVELISKKLNEAMKLLEIQKKEKLKF